MIRTSAHAAAKLSRKTRGDLDEFLEQRLMLWDFAPEDRMSERRANGTSMGIDDQMRSLAQMRRSSKRLTFRDNWLHPHGDRDRRNGTDSREMSIPVRAPESSAWGLE